MDAAWSDGRRSIPALRPNEPRRNTLSVLQPASRLGGVIAIALAASLTAAAAQAPAAKPWLDPSLLAAAKAEGLLIVYSSTNEQEGLPLFKLFEDATGIKV